MRAEASAGATGAAHEAGGGGGERMVISLSPQQPLLRGEGKEGAESKGPAAGSTEQGLRRAFWCF